MVKSRSQSGQAVLIVLLSLSVVLIIVLYIMSRSVTDLSLSSKEENSLRAFSAAEAGIERAFLTIADSFGTVGDSTASFDARVSSFGQGETSIIYPVSLKSGEIATFWFAPHQGVVGDSQFNGNQVTFCWGDPDTSVDQYAPAIELSVYYGDITNLQIARATFDPNSARAEANGFDSANSNCTIGDDNFEFETSVNLASLGANSDLKYANVRILYNTTVSHKIGIDVTGVGVLPSQGNKVLSAGSFEGANRKIEVYETYKVTPPIFENSLFSANGIVK